MMMSRRGHDMMGLVIRNPLEITSTAEVNKTAAIAAAATASASATTPTTSALLNESRQLLLKQQLKLQLNLNVSEMMDSLRRNVDDYNFTKYDGDLNRNLARVQEEKDQKSAAVADRNTTETLNIKDTNVTMARSRDSRSGQNKLDTVTTVPQLQQTFNKFNIIEATADASQQQQQHHECVATSMSSLSPSTSSATLAYTSLTQKEPQNTALAKFNRIIDNTVPVINHQPQQQQQHQHVVEMPLLSDSLKRRLASHHYTDLVVNNSKINFSSDRSEAAALRIGEGMEADKISSHEKQTLRQPNQPPSPPIALTSQISSLQQQQPKPKDGSFEDSHGIGANAAASKKVSVEDNQLKRNDVHYLLKQLNSFSDIEEIEIVDMKQKQRQQQQQKLIRDKPQEEHQQQYAGSSPLPPPPPPTLHTIHQQGDKLKAEILTVNLPPLTTQDISNASKTTTSASATTSSSSHTNNLPQYVATLPQYISSYSQDISGISSQSKGKGTTVSSDHLDLRSSTAIAPTITTNTQHYVQLPPLQHIADGATLGDYAIESKQHFHHEHSSDSPPPVVGATTPSPTATSLVIYSPSSQSHKGIRRYASLHQQNEKDTLDQHHHHHHYHDPNQPHQRRYHHHHPSQQHHQHTQSSCYSQTHHPMNTHYICRLPHEHYSEGSILDSVAAQAAACDPLALQQFVDDYIFQSCHYLETNNFAANYCTAMMVESSSHEFRPSTTTTTRTSNEEYDDEECYVEDHSSAHSFELHECEPPTVICKAPAPAPMAAQTMPQHIRASMRHLIPLAQAPPPQYTMETRLCSSGVQTDLTASSLAQSFSLSSSLSSSEQRKRRQPIFKCCYTPLDRWREKRQQQQQQQQQQQIQLQKRTKTIKNQEQQQEQSSTYYCSAKATATTNITHTAAGTTTTTSCLKNASSVTAVVSIAAAASGDDGPVTTSITPSKAAAATSSSSAIVLHSQHHSLTTKNAPYAV
ncbi:uncharacterized protein LOC142227025 [Haematobia irritans]|uniref:uncharacterized protein LOC142227025 n=1 Tax=Haematobia irritans TaxID=7368 RepID=UPI003F4F5B59